jgi:predicted acyl esterase
MSNVITDMPHKVKVIEHFWITLKDGTRLAARMWLPEDAEKNPVPAVLEYIPYRKRDGTRGRDEPMHHYFAVTSPVTAMRQSASISAAPAIPTV